MTTIAYNHKDKHIAVDSRVTAGTFIVCDEAIKFITNDIGLWFIAGSTSDYDEAVTYNHNDKVKNVDNIPDTNCYVVKNGKCYAVYFDEGYCKHAELKYSAALGSGAGLAVAAMDHGKSAEMAVEYAMTRDSMTGGKVHHFEVDGL